MRRGAVIAVLALAALTPASLVAQRKPEARKAADYDDSFRKYS
jgi:hypothetical protein